MQEEKSDAAEANEQQIAKSASMEYAKKAWAECASLAAKLGGGAKALWSRIHPDRSPPAMLAAMNESQARNKQRLEEIKPELDKAYGEIVSKKKAYQSASPARQRLLKMELQTLLVKYKGLEREFNILCENERSIEMVKGRFLEVLAYGKRGRLDADMVDRLADDVDDKADEAEDIQSSLDDLARAGKRQDRAPDNFDEELAGFDGELGLSAAENENSNHKEVDNENRQKNTASADCTALADFGGDIA
ncbi:MAG: hypothetical protein ACI4Q3_07160 [Kiritimatiellia bacterium]